jgi:UDP-2,3-diacylglucosamine hydrolase
MIYFISDAHLVRELSKTLCGTGEKTCTLLDMVKADASQIFLMGDMFDFWFEYKTVVPKGFVRFLGKLTELADAGIEIHFFTGNHDIWTFGYLENEIGLKVHRKPETMQLGSKSFFLAHGDGVDAGDKKFHFIRSIPHKLAQNFSVGCLPVWTELWFTNGRANRKKYTEKNRNTKVKTMSFW